MEKSNKEYLADYGNVADEIKFITNSFVRLKLLTTLFEKPYSMNEINKKTGLSYSSLSTNLHFLELEGYIFRDLNKYYISNVTKFYLRELLELNITITFCNNFFKSFNDHIIINIPKKSIKELYLLNNIQLVESDDINVYKTYKLIQNILMEADFIKGIFPFSQLDFLNSINEVIDKNIKMDILFSEDIANVFLDKINYYNSNIKIASFDNSNNFLLIVTDKSMALGFFKNEGNFDQNRLLISEDKQSLKWANRLFYNFKRENSIQKIEKYK